MEEKKLLKPMELSDFFDISFYLLRRNFLLFVCISGIVIVPAYSIIGICFSKINQNLIQSLMQIVVSIFQPIVVAAATYAISKRYLGESCTVWQAYGAVFKRFFPFVWTTIVVGLIMMAGSLAFIFPMIIMSFWYTFVTPVFMMEGLQFKDARVRSKHLAEGHWYRIFLINLLYSIIAGFITGILILPAAIILGVFAASSKSADMVIPAWYWIYIAVATAIQMTIQMVVPVLLYYDIKIRKEGFDLEMLASSITKNEQSGGTISGAV